ncbi:MAG: hypothetical protein BGO55_14995 [Sphingobacteriales bacterium 50-39]|nr:hypothetical protein [Sphingobacteriales bacterium]OJW54683.1 MAG: hypothetical protein BGO55_14995 [Sphingobacteriales bacterium 50-39]
MTTTIAVVSLFLTVTLSMGGGLYEILVIYPGWKHDVNPLTLRARLQSSGQILAAKRFWPIVSPAQILLSVINIPLAWNHAGGGQACWLAAAVAVFISRLITFSYFIPVMIRKIMQPENIEATRLRAIVKQWITLSPLRLVFEIFAWIMLVVALMHL